MLSTAKKWKRLFRLIKAKKLQFHPPIFNWKTVQENVNLPRKFCGACSLREGSAVVVVITQAVFAAIAAIALIIQRRYSRPITKWWNGVLERDYAPWFKFKCVDNSCINTGWEWILDGLVGVIALYELFGMTLILALCCGKSHPFFLLPWMVVTGILQVLYYASAIFLLVMACMNSTKRNLSVTMDMSPIVLYMVFALIWTYGYFVVISYFSMKNRKRKAAKAQLKLLEQKLVKKSKIAATKLVVPDKEKTPKKRNNKESKLSKKGKLEKDIENEQGDTGTDGGIVEIKGEKW